MTLLCLIIAGLFLFMTINLSKMPGRLIFMVDSVLWGLACIADS